MLCFQQSLKAQDSIENAMMSMQEIMTEIASRSDDQMNMDELTENLINLVQNPIQINSATNDELGKLFWLSEFQIQNIRKYIVSNGTLASIYEIPYIEGFSETDAKMLSPFVMFEITRKEYPLTPEKVLHNSRHRLLFRSQRVIEKQKGFKVENQDGSGCFKGGPFGTYFRYSLRIDNKILAGITAGNDAGEEFFTGSNKNGFDFYSFYLQVNKLKFIKTLLIGDYRAYFGQGLSVWSGFNFGKSPIVMSSMQRNPGFSRYQSSDENNFFRGSALTFDLKPFEVSCWVSRHRLDANISGRDTLTNDISEVSSLQTSGLHSTLSELADEDAINSTVAGSNITLVKPNLRTGITAVYYTYSEPLEPGNKPYSYYFFSGNSNFNVSCDFRYRAGNLILFGEEATSKSHGIALLNGIQSYVNSRLSFTILSRYYQRNYSAMYGNAFGENARNNNETGVFAGLECKPFKYITLSGYMDVFKFPWLTYSVDMPSSGRDFLAQINLDPNTRLQTYLQYRCKSKEDNFSDENGDKNIIASIKQERIRYNLSYTASDNITVRSRLERSFYKNEYSGTRKGFYLGQDVEFSMAKLPFRLYLRYALFDTDDYNSRVYAYENDLLYTFSIPSFYDKGSREYVMIRYSPSSHIDVWLKYAITQYTNRETVGTGPYEIDGNRKSEIKLQVLLKLY